MTIFALQPNRTLARAHSASSVGCALAWAMGGIDNFHATKALRTLQPGVQCSSRQREKRS
jgi:hypothetical protein